MDTPGRPLRDICSSGSKRRRSRSKLYIPGKGFEARDRELLSFDTFRLVCILSIIDLLKVSCSDQSRLFSVFTFKVFLVLI